MKQHDSLFKTPFLLTVGHLGKSLLRHFGPIFTFKTAITQRLFGKSKTV